MNAQRFPNGLETRSVGAELRAAGGRTLVGHAAVFDRPTQIGGYSEIVRRGAFSESIASGADIFLLAHHSWDQPLARTGNGSLTLQEDGVGLRFEAELPATRSADDILELARAGTIAGCSFGFRCPKGGDAWPTPGFRELKRVQLVEISAVAQPQYAGTSIAARAHRRAEADAYIRRLLATL